MFAYHNQETRELANILRTADPEELTKAIAHFVDNPVRDILADLEHLFVELDGICRLTSDGQATWTMVGEMRQRVFDLERRLLSRTNPTVK
jgi:hypothetical protein